MDNMKDKLSTGEYNQAISASVSDTGNFLLYYFPYNSGADRGDILPTIAVIPLVNDKISKSEIYETNPIITRVGNPADTYVYKYKWVTGQDEIARMYTAGMFNRNNKKITIDFLDITIPNSVWANQLMIDGDESTDVFSITSDHSLITLIKTDTSEQEGALHLVDTVSEITNTYIFPHRYTDIYSVGSPEREKTEVALVSADSEKATYATIVNDTKPNYFVYFSMKDKKFVDVDLGE